MRRVVVTGIGIVSCIGNNQDEVAASQMLRNGRLSRCMTRSPMQN